MIEREIQTDMNLVGIKVEKAYIDNSGRILNILLKKYLRKKCQVVE